PADRSAVARSLLKVPFTTEVRTLSIRCAPLGNQRICRVKLADASICSAWTAGRSADRGNHDRRQSQQQIGDDHRADHLDRAALPVAELVIRPEPDGN